jgi:hypothetical protein
MKKRRGLRRYYKNLATQNDFESWDRFNFRDDPEHWFDLWHWHFDWSGLGNDSFKRRRPHLDKLFRHFDIIVEKVEHLKLEFQLFAIINDKNSASDAVYLHTPNPNDSEFPLTWDNLSEECTLKNRDLIGYLNRLPQYEKLYGIGSEPFCILTVGNTGLDKTLYCAESDAGNYWHR